MAVTPVGNLYREKDCAHLRHHSSFSASFLSDAPWPATKDELIDYSIRTGSPLEVVENLQSIEDEGDLYESIQEIWPDYPTDDDYLWNEDEY